jgi:hypothetical protein
MRTFIFEDGMITFAFRAVMALRMRVSISAIGSVIVVPLPARLHDAGDVSTQRELTEAQTAQPELPDEGARTAALRAAVALADLELPLAIDHLRQARHR